MLDSVKQKIEKHRIKNLQKLSKFEFEDLNRPSDRTKEEKISRLHSMTLWLESVLSVRRVILLVVLSAILIAGIYPFMKYVVITFDKFYFGYFVEREPRLALTTS